LVALLPPRGFAARCWRFWAEPYYIVNFRDLFALGWQGKPQLLNTAQAKLSYEIIAYWSSFARTGVPTLPGKTAALRWERYSPAR
jgi:hypothetical protein